MISGLSRIDVGRMCMLLAGPRHTFCADYKKKENVPKRSWLNVCPGLFFGVLWFILEALWPILGFDVCPKCLQNLLVAPRRRTCCTPQKAPSETGAKKQQNPMKEILKKCVFGGGKNLPKCGTVVAKRRFRRFRRNREMASKW